MAEAPEIFDVPNDLESDPDEIVPEAAEWDDQTPGTPDWYIAGPNVDPREYDVEDPGSGEPPDLPTDPGEPDPELPDPPAAPSALLASAVSSSQINLSWTRNSTTEDGFRIERSAVGGGSGFVAIDTVVAGVTVYSDINLPANTQFFYRVIAFNAGGDSAASGEADDTTDAAAVPTAPTGLMAVTVSPGQNDLTWTDNASDEDDYRIERSLLVDQGFVEIDQIAANSVSYSDTTADPQTEYFYRVRASNALGFSAYSNVAAASGGLYSNGYSNRYPIKISPNMVTEVLDNFMIRLEIQADWLKLETVDPVNGRLKNANGYDLIFEELNGTPMPYDRRDQDTTAGTLECWIYGAQVFAGHAFYIYVGNASVSTDQQDKVAMWANVATMVLDCRTGTDFSGKQSPTVVIAPGTTTLKGDAGQGVAKITVPLGPLLNGDTEQSSMCWIRADSIGNDQGWVETLADENYAPSISYAVWSQRFDLAGAESGSVNCLKYGVGGFIFETNSNRQLLNERFIAQTWAMGEYPKLYVDGGTPEFQAAATGLPSSPLLGSGADVMEIFNGLQDWAGALDEYIQFDRELSEAFVNAAYQNQLNVANFLTIGAEGEEAVPGEDPGDPQNPPQPATAYDAFFNDRTLPTIPTPDTSVDVSSWSALVSALATAAAATGETRRVRLTADITVSGVNTTSPVIQPDVSLIVDFNGFKITGNGSQVTLYFDGVMSNWNTGGDNSKVSSVSTANGKTTVVLTNPITGLAVGDWVKIFAPMIDSTKDWRLGANIWSRKPQSNRIGQALQVESINGTTIVFSSALLDAIGQYPVVAASGRLWAVKYETAGRPGQAALYIQDLDIRNSGISTKWAVYGIANAFVISPYIDQNSVVPSGSYPSMAHIGGVRCKVFDPVFDSTLGATKMGFGYAWNALGGSSQNVVCNTDAFAQPYNMVRFRNYGDSSSFDLNTGMSDSEMARKAGAANLWGVNRAKVKDTSGTGCLSTHSGSLGTRFNAYEQINSANQVTQNHYQTFRSVAGVNLNDNIIEGFNLTTLAAIAAAVWQFYNESSESLYICGGFNGCAGSPTAWDGSDNACFGYLIRNGYINFDKNISLYYLSGGWRGPLKFGPGVTIDARVAKELFYFDPGSSGNRAIGDILPDPRLGWEVQGGSTYRIHNGASRGGSLRNGANCKMGLVGGIPTFDLSTRTTPWTLMDIAGGTVLEGQANLINPNAVPVGVTGSGNQANFQLNTL